MNTLGSWLPIGSCLFLVFRQVRIGTCSTPQIRITIRDPSGVSLLNATTSPSEEINGGPYAYDYALLLSAMPGTYSVIVSFNPPCGLVYGSGTFRVTSTITMCTTITEQFSQANCCVPTYPSRVASFASVSLLPQQQQLRQTAV
jgi:hypothetical protein